MACDCEDLGGCLPIPGRDDLGGLTFVDFEGDDDIGGLQEFGFDDAGLAYDDDGGEVDGILDDALSWGKKAYDKLSGGSKKKTRKAQQRARKETRRASQLEGELAKERARAAQARQRAAYQRQVEAKERELQALREQQAIVRARKARLDAARRKKMLKWGLGLGGAGAAAYGAWKLARATAA